MEDPVSSKALAPPTMHMATRGPLSADEFLSSNSSAIREEEFHNGGRGGDSGGGDHDGDGDGDGDEPLLCR